MEQRIIYVGLDVHKDTIAVALAEAGKRGSCASMARSRTARRRKRSIRGGRPRARQALYMPALDAIRLNPEFKAKYEAMVKAGKPA